MKWEGEVKRDLVEDGITAAVIYNRKEFRSQTDIMAFEEKPYAQIDNIRVAEKDQK